jgi:hypothetical protein
MNYNNVIPFDRGEQVSFRDSRPVCVVLPSPTTTEMIRPVEIQSATTFGKAMPASAEVLFEQLEYLIQFADEERDRFDRVKAILLETFN